MVFITTAVVASGPQAADFTFSTVVSSSISGKGPLTTLNPPIVAFDNGYVFEFYPSDLSSFTFDPIPNLAAVPERAAVTTSNSNPGGGSSGGSSGGGSDRVGMPPRVIAGIVSGVLVFIASLLGTWCGIAYRRRKRKRVRAALAASAGPTSTIVTIDGKQHVITPLSPPVANTTPQQVPEKPSGVIPQENTDPELARIQRELSQVEQRKTAIMQLQELDEQEERLKRELRSREAELQRHQGVNSADEPSSER
jgi:hypothetical protein